ncbi:MAG: tRNA (N6-threonylcarbamoyladenosine(37)-N6)-methyltransferase TrmO [Clostridiales bacterium]|nr:tRNA (N6-threonylcarbamoyladenosine(37)-N6)-methyltransferase TrmO [Candidatus Crickella caballi]
MEFQAIAHVHTGYPEKFGIPRQSGLIDAPGYITFESPYDDANAFRGLEEYDRIWLIWLADGNMNSNGKMDWRPTVRPPRLGGNDRKGIYATRSPYHPNGIGLSCVKLLGVHIDGSDFGVAGPVVEISGMDLVDGTPLIDIKPYVPYADSFPEAKCSFATPPEDALELVLAEGIAEQFDKANNLTNKPSKTDDISEQFANSGSDAAGPTDDLSVIIEMVRRDPRPRYQDDPKRVYGMCYKDYNIKFNVENGVAHIIEIEQA